MLAKKILALNNFFFVFRFRGRMTSCLVWRVIGSIRLGEESMEENRKGSWTPGLTSCLLVVILAIVAIQFLLFISGGRYGFKGLYDLGKPYAPEGLYTVVPMDPGTSGLFGRAVLTNRQTGESWIIFPNGTTSKVERKD